MSVETTQELWGGETRKAVANFPVSGERVPVAVVRWLGRIKGAAARANAELGLLDADLAQRIGAAADEIAQGRHDGQFPIDVFQTGSGTSSNMNANEVIAALAGDGAHPNDHVNMGQSSNDVFPSAVHLAALDEATNSLLPALERLEKAFADKAEAFKDIVKSGRTHLMDAVPVTLGQEFAGYAAQIRLGRARVADALPRVAQIPLGGTATGTGLNTHPDFAGEGARGAERRHRARDPRARGPVRGAGQPRRAGRAVGRAEGARGVADQDRERPRADGLRPARRHRRDLPARAAEGLVDHARQGEPGAARGRAPGERAGDRQRHGDHDRRPPGPVRAERADPADRPQPAPVDPPARPPRASCSQRSASRGSRPTSRAASAPPRARSPSPPRSTRTSATTAPPRSSRTPRAAAARCARSRASTASTRRRSTRR